jgi:hypothetical protein
MTLLCLAATGSALSWSAPSRAADPCDFASSGESVFSHARVRECYAQVPFSPDALRGIVQVVRQHRSFSDLAEIYDARVQWRSALDELEARAVPGAYANDLAMHDALKREHQRFRNAHVSYVPPGCYWRMLNSFVPVELGSTLVRSGRRREQIIFVEEAIAPELYAAATGIDPTALVGQRVISINGVPALEYLSRYADAQRSHEDTGGGLNGVLSALEYTVRLGGPSDFVAERAADTFVLESIEGVRQRVELPWLFLPSAALLGDFALPLTASTQEFVELCEQGPAEGVPPPDSTPPDATVLESTSAAWGLHGRDMDRHRRRMQQRLRERWQHRGPRPRSYYEVPPERLGQDLQEIIPLTAQARVLQYGADVTAIQLADTVAWIDVAREGIEHACEQSERLILDLRNNGGGNDTVIRWLHHYLFPEDGLGIAAGQLPLRVRNDDAAFAEVLFNFAEFARDYLPALGLEACTLFMVPGCLLDIDTEAPLPADQLDWFRSPTYRERRAGARLSLSRQIALPNIGDPEFDSASCAGRFAGDDLILLTNGGNASGGYFLPAAFKGDGVIVNTGGVVGQPMAMGRARGGATVSGSLWSSVAGLIEAVSEGEISFEHELASFPRPVETQMEMLGAYREDRRRLHIEAPIEADLHVDVWTNLEGSEGFVYEQVLRAVDQRR